MLSMTILKIISSLQLYLNGKFNIENSESLVLFKKCILAFIRPSVNSTFHCHNHNGLELFRRLRLGLSHLWFHEFERSFQDTLNPMCNCGTVETIIHCVVHCPNISNERLSLFNKLQIIDENIICKDNSNISNVFLFGDHSLLM